MKYRGDSITIRNTIKDENGNLMDPDSHSIKIFDPTGTQSGSEITNPTQESLGVFRITFDIPLNAAFGSWNVQWRAVKGTYVETEIFYFAVAKKPNE